MICPICKDIYPNGTVRCPICSFRLEVYEEPSISSYGFSEEHDKSEIWPYIVSALIPIVGLIVGLVFIGQQRQEGPSTLGVSIVAGIIWAIIGGLMFF